MVTIVKCKCGDAVCNRYGLSDGVFYQGNGWEKERAQEYADAINAYDAGYRPGRSEQVSDELAEELANIAGDTGKL